MFLFSQEDEVYEKLQAAMRTVADGKIEVPPLTASESFTTGGDLSLTQDDWDYLLKGAELVSFKKGGVFRNGSHPKAR